ncbi:MAG: DivIVA domain-containing protein [Eubacteriales bacterium]|nr:DivIVA domain-containing protein [Eubacteriales bacterium]MDD4389306.1 DivIVA domain-containing protein [Eubacteriales bacterium]
MITPLDIQNKEFSKVVRGYKEEEVDAFLDLITVDMEKLLQENVSLKENISKLSEDLTRYKSSEGAVLETLEAAKALMSDISGSAEKRAEILLKNAELDAELIQREARESVERLTEEGIRMKNNLAAFKTKYRSFLESEFERFENVSYELFFDAEGVKQVNSQVPETENNTFHRVNMAVFDSDTSNDKTMVLKKIKD